MTKVSNRVQASLKGRDCNKCDLCSNLVVQGIETDHSAYFDGVKVILSNCEMFHNRILFKICETSLHSRFTNKIVWW